MSAHVFTVYDMISRGASLHGEAPAVIQGETLLSFQEFKRRVDELAGGLGALGIGKGDRVCILAQNDTAYLVLYGACARLGILAYPINWRLTAEEVSRVVERAAPKMMVADASTLPVVMGSPASKPQVAHWYLFGRSGGQGFEPFDSLYGGSESASPAVSAGDPFAAISTAAVDVVPRGAVLTHANVIAANLTTMASMGLSAADRYLLALPLFHITAFGLSLAHMQAGGANVIVPRFDAEEAVRLIDRHGITHVSDFPPVLASLLDAAEKMGSSLRTLTHVSGLDSPQTILRLHEKTGAQFWTGFGQSETSGFVTLQRMSERPGASGKPVPLSQVAVVVDDDGYLYYVKRKPEKELIKPGGENVYPAEVETVIMQMEGVSGVCVYGIPDARWGEAIKAVVEVTAAGRYTADQVSDFVASKIARFKRPHVVVFADALARAADGGVDREAVKSKWGAGT